MSAGFGSNARKKYLRGELDLRNPLNTILTTSREHIRQPNVNATLAGTLPGWVRILPES